MLPSAPPQHVSGFNDMNSGLVAMQRVQDYLEIKEKRLTQLHREDKIYQWRFGTAFVLGQSLRRTYMSL